MVNHCKKKYLTTNRRHNINGCDGEVTYQASSAESARYVKINRVLCDPAKHTQGLRNAPTQIVGWLKAIL